MKLKINKKPQKVEVGDTSRIMKGESSNLGEDPFMVYNLFSIDFIIFVIIYIIILFI